ncbi:MAG: putative Ig domain-containing protein, partial [Pseudomonadota bacterium]
TQAWTLYVGIPAATEPGPAFSSVPVTFATPGVQYRYVFRVNSSLPTPPVVSLFQAPATMVLDPLFNALVWVPTTADIGSQAIELLAVDSNGEEARQRFDLQVLPELPNQPPYLTSSPTLNARIGSPYSYAAAAIDPEFEALSYSLLTAPAEMTIDPVTGQVDWLPQAGDPASSVVTLQAQDPQGGQASQTFTIQLRAANVDPVITTVPPTSAIVGEFYSTRFLVNDGDGDAVRFRLLQGPRSMTLHPTLGWLHWTTIGEMPGVYPVVLEVTDDWGGRQELGFSLTLVPDTESPEVAASLAPNPACEAEVSAVCVAATDNVGLTDVSLAIDGESFSLDSSRCTLWTPPAAGLIPLLATATDPSGQTGQVNQTLTVIDCNDEQAPVVTLNNDLTGTAYNQPEPIVVTIDDNTPDILTWEVTQRALSSDVATVLATGTGPVLSGEVAVFNPTSLQSGDYEIVVEASDGAQTGGIRFIMASGTGNKPGRIQFASVDAVLPVAGLPISIGRSYDSLEAVDGGSDTGDFGPGWRLLLSASVEDTAADLGPDSGGLGQLGGEAFSTATRVTVTKPNGERVAFQFAPKARSFPSVFQFDVEYEPDPGVTDQLRAVGWPDTVFQLGTGFANYVIPYNPSRYELETEEGLVYLIDEFDGLIEIRDVLGGTLEVTSSGLRSSWGVSVDYLRDSEGRIVEIVLPESGAGRAPTRLLYRYDGVGNLVGATDAAGNESTFVYGDPDHPHHVTDLFDQLGNPIARHVFDEEGRMIAHCEANANIVTLAGCSLLDFDVENRVETIFDPRGFRSDLFFDEQGLLSVRRDWFNGSEFIEQQWTYDEAGRELVYTDGDGGVTTRAYDENGNEISTTFPSGATW